MVEDQSTKLVKRKATKDFAVVLVAPLYVFRMSVEVRVYKANESFV
jgi:hypothetical protein